MFLPSGRKVLSDYKNYSDRYTKITIIHCYDMLLIHMITVRENSEIFLNTMFIFFQQKNKALEINNQLENDHNCMFIYLIYKLI